MWRALMGRGGFDTATIWLVFFDAGSRTQSVIVPVEGIPAEPDVHSVRKLAWVVRDLIDGAEIASVAVLLSRPGPRSMSEADRRWARALRAELGELTAWPLHLATREHVQIFAPDDLVAAS
jgi:hypothetical protein